MVSFASRWLSNKLVNWGVAVQRREIKSWLRNLRSLNSDDLGMIVTIATHVRHKIELKYHVDLLDPIVTYARDPDIELVVHQMIKAFQSSGMPESAAGAMVWLHTLRCGAALELRPLGRELWRELRRGFPFIEQSAAGLELLSDQQIIITDATRIPFGLEPDRT